MYKIFFICALFAVAHIVMAEDEVDKSEEGSDFICEAGTMVLNQEIMDGLKECTEEYQDKLNCKYFCNAEQFDLLNEEGVPTQDTYDEWVDAEFQEKDREVAKTHFADCFSKYGSGFGSANRDDNESCTEVKKFNDCTWALPPQTC